MAKKSNCLQLIGRMPPQDQDALLARLDELLAKGMPAKEAQLQATMDVLAQVERERDVAKAQDRARDAVDCKENFYDQIRKRAANNDAGRGNRQAWGAGLPATFRGRRAIAGGRRGGCLAVIDRIGSTPIPAASQRFMDPLRLTRVTRRIAFCSRPRTGRGW